MNLSPKLQRKLLLSLVVLLVAVLLLVWKSCNTKAQLSAYKEQMQKFELGEQKFITTINNKGERINEQEQLILSQKDAIAHNVLELENLKKVKSQVIVRTNTIIDSVIIPFDDSWMDEDMWDVDDDDIVFINDTTFLVQIDDTTFVNLDSLKAQYKKEADIIFVPKKFSLIDEHYSMFGKVQKNGLLLDSLRMKNDLTMTIGMKSQGFLKKPKPLVLAKNSNPYFQTYSMQNVIIKNELKWYDKKATWFGIGIIGGFVGGVLINNK